MTDTTRTTSRAVPQGVSRRTELTVARDGLRGLREDLLSGALAFRPLPPLPEDHLLLRFLPGPARGVPRRLPHLALVALTFLLVSTEIAKRSHDGDGALVRALFLAVPMVMVMFRPVGAFWLSIAGLPFAAAVTDSPSGGWPWSMPAFLAHLTVTLLAAARTRSRTALFLWLLTALAGGLVAAWTPRQYGGSNAFAMVVVSGIALLLLLALRGWRDSRRQVVEQVAVTREERTRRTLLEERTTIARELHDVVAHHMSVVAIQAEAAPYRVEDPPEELVKALATIRENAVAALAELRRVLGVVRADLPADPADRGPEAPQPTLAELDDLLAGVRAAGLEVEAVSTGGVRPLPPGVELSAYRIVQEALSNTLRHAPGASARVELGYVPVGLGLRIVNGPPTGLRKPSPGAGHGVLGMRERVAMLGGELTAGETDDGGFAVEAFLPVTDGEPA